jgi:hypothetical protein
MHLVKETEISEPEISVIRAPSFQKIYATNVSVIATDSDFRIELFNEKFKVEGGWAYNSESLMILTAEAAKKLSIILDEKIRSYEKEHAEIQVIEDKLKFHYLI